MCKVCVQNTREQMITSCWLVHLSIIQGNKVLKYEFVRNCAVLLTRALLATNTEVKMSESRPKYLPWVAL